MASKRKLPWSKNIRKQYVRSQFKSWSVPWISAMIGNATSILIFWIYCLTLLPCYMLCCAHLPMAFLSISWQPAALRCFCFHYGLQWGLSYGLILLPCSFENCFFMYIKREKKRKNIKFTSFSVKLKLTYFQWGSYLKPLIYHLIVPYSRKLWLVLTPHMVTHGLEFADFSLFGVIFIFICLISALFSCVVSNIARKSMKIFNNKDILPIRYNRISLRKYSEVSSSDSNILYWWSIRSPWWSITRVF